MSNDEVLPVFAEPLWREESPVTSCCGSSSLAETVVLSVDTRTRRIARAKRPFIANRVVTAPTQMPTQLRI